MEAKVMSATVSRQGERYFVSFQIGYNADSEALKLDKAKSIGLDVGIKSRLTLSNGNMMESPKALKISLNKLKKHQKCLC